MLTDKPPFIVRLKLAFFDIGSSRVIRSWPIGGDDAIVKRHGFASVDDLWSKALSETMTAKDFIHYLTEFFDPYIVNNASGRTGTTSGLAIALETAYGAREPWVFLDGRASVFQGHQSLQVRALEAAQWLAKPMRRHMLPPSLIDFLGRDLSTSSDKHDAKPPRRRGPLPKKTGIVMDAMRSYSNKDLLGMKDSVLQAEFGGKAISAGGAPASIGTCRNARERLIEERPEI